MSKVWVTYPEQIQYHYGYDVIFCVWKITTLDQWVSLTDRELNREPRVTGCNQISQLNSVGFLLSTIPVYYNNPTKYKPWSKKRAKCAQFV